VTDDDHVPCCHLCGTSAVECDIDGCLTCNRLVCPDCSVEIETEDGEAAGVICAECDELSRQGDAT
jgi:hypothetical protein